MLTLLWTDIAVFALVIAGMYGAWASSKKEHLRRPWGQVFESTVGVVSLTMLLVFILVGVLDSVRIQHHDTLASGEVSEHAKTLSLLDIVLTPIRTRVEKTYSMPFAHTAYAKEMVADSNGQSQWHYPRLVFAVSHLAYPEVEKTSDIGNKILMGVAVAVLVWLLLILFITGIRGQHPFKQDTNGLKSCVWTLLAVFLLLGATANLAPYYHILGTDKVGEDVLYQAIKSIRTGLVIGALTTIVMLPIAISLGLMAGFFRGWVDDVIQYLYTTLSSIPGVLLIAAAILMAQVYMANNPELFTTLEDRADMRLLLLCMILGVTSWTGLCRLLRAETLKIREMDYVVAAQALGVKRLQILKRHVLPNVMHLVMITVVLDFSGLVLAEAVLSYINIGVDPSTYSWGNMINTSRLEMAREPIVWWSLAASFVFMFTLVLAANLFADVVRDAFDPRANN
ncbi:MAG TPA: ABC transporter permease [Cycloclasticus sp.]|jgi:peptide/nickel transport system permease protein|nr:ABC transporter permease [Cycloclasticus sp.]HIL91964.1 ABC transporter permease [Cycloclasticus sp.]